MKGLHYFCAQPYERGHKSQLKQSQLFLVEIPGCEEVGEVQEGIEDMDVVEFEAETIDPHIFVHALSDNHNFQTTRVFGMCRKQPLEILINLGSTHNFLDVGVARLLA